MERQEPRRPGDAERLAVSREIPAPAAAIFDLVSDPQGHVRIDGSGMLVATSGTQRLSAVGDTFAMAMDRAALGDLPMGEYDVLNTVTRIEPDRLLEWSVGGAGRSPLGHVYGYQLEPLPGGGTRVTSYCDWSDLNPKLRGHITFPVVPAAMMTETLDRLAALVVG